MQQEDYIMSVSNQIRCALRGVALALVLSYALPAKADTVIGNWESAAPEGWIDWSSGETPLAAPRFGYGAIGATLGTTALQFNLPATGFTQWASIKLQGGSNGVDEWRDDFIANTKVAVDVTLVASEMAIEPGNNFATIGLVVNAEGYGFNGIGDPESVTPFTGYNGANNFNPQLLSGTQTTTWVWDISALHDDDPLTPVAPRTPGEVPAAANWIELIFDMYSNGAVVYHIDNVRLFTPSLQGDFDNNDVVDAADLADKWKPGYGMTGQTNDDNGDADADGDVDGADFLIWQRQLGAVSAGVVAAAAVPEPAAASLLIASLVMAVCATRRARP
jgi:hypothetical protein